jgi:hypothetical protein
MQFSWEIIEIPDAPGASPRRWGATAGIVLTCFTKKRTFQYTLFQGIACAMSPRRGRSWRNGGISSFQRSFLPCTFFYYECCKTSLLRPGGETEPGIHRPFQRPAGRPGCKKKVIIPSPAPTVRPIAGATGMQYPLWVFLLRTYPDRER